MTALWTILASAALTGPALQETAPLPPETGLAFTLQTGVWFPRLGGVSAAPGSNAEVDLALQLGLEDSSPTLNVELGVRKDGKWELYFGGFRFETDHAGPFQGSGTFGGIMLSQGDPVVASFELLSFSAELHYTAWRPYADDASWRNKFAPDMDNHNPDGRYTIDLRFSPMFGMRWLDVDQAITAGAATVKTGGEWVAAYAGLDIELDYRPPEPIPMLKLFQLKLNFAFGPAFGGTGGSMWQVRGGLTVQFTEMFGATFGYRLVELNVENDDYSFDGGLQGLFLAASLRF